MRVPANRGFTLVEILVVVAIIGILANLTIPQVMRALWRARAADIVTDFELIQTATYQPYRDHGFWPRGRGIGREPPELKPYLEGKVQWSRHDLGFDYEWENWLNANDTPKKKKTGVKYGLSLRGEAERVDDLVSAIDEIYDGPKLRVAKKRFTFVMEYFEWTVRPAKPKILRVPHRAFLAVESSSNRRVGPGLRVARRTGDPGSEVVIG